MAEFPINKPVTLRYLPELPKDIPLAGSVGGMYATATDEQRVELAPISPEFPEQTWVIVPGDRGFKIQLYQNIKGVPPVGLGEAWHNSSPAPSTPIKLSGLKDASSYYLNVVTGFEDGWIISIAPLGVWIGVDRFIGASNDNTVEIVSEPIRHPRPFPGWFVREASA